MASPRRLLLATVLVACMVATALPMAQAQAVNRAPHPVLGPDQIVGDSVSPCQPGTTLVGCREIFFDFSQSWDPDGDNLEKSATYSFPGISTVPNTPECDFELLALIPISGEAGKFKTYAPVITTPTITRCVITLTVQVDDGKSGQPAPNYCCATDTIVVTVLNGNEPPRFDCTPNLQCTTTALMVNGLRNPPAIDLLLHRGRFIEFTAYNVQDDRETVSMEVFLDLLGRNDELLHRLVVPMHKCGSPATGGHNDPVCLASIGTACLQLWPCDQVGDDTFVLTAIDRVCCTAGPPADTEVSSWLGRLAVDTRELVRGSYTVTAIVHDADGASTSFPPEKVRLEVDGPEGTCYPACILINQPVYLNRPDVGPKIQTRCFPDALPKSEDRFVFALGHGETLRPVIQTNYPPDDETDPMTGLPYQLSDPNLFLRKVTYRTCREMPGFAEPVYGPVNTLEPPYHLPLDALFKGQEVDQELEITVYDRLNGVASGAVHIIVDTTRPEYLIDRPEVNYQDIPFQFNVLVHDRLFSEVSLHIDNFELQTDFDNRTTTNTLVPKGNLTISNVPWLMLPGCAKDKPRCTVGELSVLQVPPLGEVIPYDVGGHHKGGDPCDYLFDSDGDGTIDSVFDPRAMNVKGKLLATRSNRGAFDDYVLDSDGDGRIGRDESIINGSISGDPLEAGLCMQGFQSPAVASFLGSKATQVFSFNLTRHMLGLTTYRVNIRDIAFNNLASPTFTFTYPAGCKVGNATTLKAGEVACQTQESNLIGRFTTVRGLVDARVVHLNVTARGYLPGDPIWVNATVAQHSDQRPEPHPGMVFGIDESVRIQCMAAWRSVPMRPLVNGTDAAGNQSKVPDTSIIPPECRNPSMVAFCNPALNTSIPVQAVQTKCYSLFPPNYSATSKVSNILKLGWPLELEPGACPPPRDPEHEFTICMSRPDLRKGVPRDRELRLPFSPGPHVLAGYVQMDAAFNDTEEFEALTNGAEPNNYLESDPFEVYIGRVVVGSMDASGHVKGSGKEYHIRADCTAATPTSTPVCRPGAPKMKGGAVLLGSNGKPVGAAFDLTYTQEPSPRYEFSPTEGTTVYWDAGAKVAVDPALCGLNATQTSGCTRPITVIPAQKPTSTTQDSPGPALAILLVMLGAAVLSRRRKE